MTRLSDMSRFAEPDDVGGVLCNDCDCEYSPDALNKCEACGVLVCDECLKGFNDMKLCRGCEDLERKESGENEI
jgi:hypothetical protein